MYTFPCEGQPASASPFKGSIWFYPQLDSTRNWLFFFFSVGENTKGQVTKIKNSLKIGFYLHWNNTQGPFLRDNVCKQAFIKERLRKVTRNRWFVFKTCLTFILQKAYYGGNSWLPIRSTLVNLSSPCRIDVNNLLVYKELKIILGV